MLLIIVSAWVRYRIQNITKMILMAIILFMVTLIMMNVVILYRLRGNDNDGTGWSKYYWWQ